MVEPILERFWINRSEEKELFESLLPLRKNLFLAMAVLNLSLSPLYFSYDYHIITNNLRHMVQARGTLIVHLIVACLSLIYIIHFLIRRKKQANNRLDTFILRTIAFTTFGSTTLLGILNQFGDGNISIYLMGMLFLIIIYEPLRIMLTVIGVSGIAIIVATRLFQMSPDVAFAVQINTINCAIIGGMLYWLNVLFQFSYYTQRMKLDEKNRILVQIQRENVELNNLRQMVLRVVSHDFRYPFYDFTRLLSLLEDNSLAYLQQHRQEIAGNIRTTLENTDLLLKNITAITQETADNQYETNGIIDLYPLFQSIIDYFQVEAEKKSIKLVVDPNPGVLIIGNKNMLLTVLRNLVSNALKFTNAHGTVKLEAKEERDTVTILLSDTGIGMGPELLKRINDGAWGFSSHGTHGEPGSGMGLSVCRYFLSLHETTLAVESGLGRGTEISFALKRFKTERPKQ
jgi:signal transduction histidine kinase